MPTIKSSCWIKKIDVDAKQHQQLRAVMAFALEGRGKERDVWYG